MVAHIGALVTRSGAGGGLETPCFSNSIQFYVRNRLFALLILVVLAVMVVYVSATP